MKKLITSEKRGYIRISTNQVKVKIIKYSHTTHQEYNEVKNISAGGLSVIYNENIEVGEDVLIIIDAYELNIKQLIKCIVTVVRVEQVNGLYDISVKFKKISSENVFLLNYFIQQNS